MSDPNYPDGVTERDIDRIGEPFPLTEEEKVKPKIYLFCVPGGMRSGDVIGYALAEDGNGLGSHLSSNEDFSKHDMGLTSNWKHDGYKKHYPEGYDLEWIMEEKLDSHARFQKALAINKELAKAIP